MDQWEYLIIDGAGGGRWNVHGGKQTQVSGDLAGVLDQLGAQGWELIQLLEPPQGTRVLLKRPKAAS
jgi:hypothetical protein